MPILGFSYLWNAVFDYAKNLNNEFEKYYDILNFPIFIGKLNLINNNYLLTKSFFNDSFQKNIYNQLFISNSFLSPYFNIEFIIRDFNPAIRNGNFTIFEKSTEINFDANISFLYDDLYLIQFSNYEYIENIQNIIKHNPAVIYKTNAKGSYTTTYISDNVNEILGYNAKRFLEEECFWDSIIVEKYQNLVKQALLNIHKTGYFEIIYQIKKADGKIKWFHEKAQLIRDFNGEPLEIVGYIIDYEHQYKLMDDLDKQNFELKAIIDIIPGLVLIYDANFSIVECSQSLSDKLKIPKNKIIGSKCFDIHDCKSLNENKCIIKDAIFNNKNFVRLSTPVEESKFGSSYKIFVNCLQNRDGLVWGAVEIWIDIDDLKSVERELHNLIYELQEANTHSNQKATRIIKLNEELEDKSVQLQKVIKQKDRFFSIIAHDLRTPLKGFMDLTSLLLTEINRISVTEIKELTNAMSVSSGNIYNLLENLLSWSKIQTGKITNHPSILELSSVIMMNIDLYLNNSNQKNIKLFNSIPRNIFVYSDVNLLNAIIRNLISNALKFTPNGGIIDISAETTEDYCIIKVKDSGVGMSEDMMSKLFKIDTYITQKGTNNEEGSGLGLILCKENAEMNGGKIWAESTLGEGSAFYLSVLLSKEIQTAV